MVSNLIGMLKGKFVSRGIPEELVSDNGPQYHLEQFIEN